MTVFGNDCKCNCVSVSVIASILIGIVTAFLTITAVITVTPVFLWVVLGIAVVYLAVTLLAVALARPINATGCILSALSALLIGILGTALLSVVLLAVSFAATSVIGAIITGALLLFFSQTITATACLVRSLAARDD